MEGRYLGLGIHLCRTQKYLVYLGSYVSPACSASPTVRVGWAVGRRKKKEGGGNHLRTLIHSVISLRFDLLLLVFFFSALQIPS